MADSDVCHFRFLGGRDVGTDGTSFSRMAADGRWVSNHSAKAESTLERPDVTEKWLRL
jgi:hypothetical protein